VDQHKSTAWLDYGSHFFARDVIRRDGSAYSNAAILRDFRRHKADPPDIDIAVLFGKPKLG
jgi:hypothetical protein